MNAAQSQALNAQAGVREIGELAIRNTEKNIAASFAFAEIADLHAEYIKSQMQAWTEQAQ